LSCIGFAKSRAFIRENLLCLSSRAGLRSHARAYNYRMDHSKLVLVQAFASQAEADLAKSMLESAGIDAMIQADRAGGMRDHLAWSGFGFKVLVREEDAATARDVLTPPRDSGLVVVQTFATQAEADTAQGALLSAGIGATIQDDSATGWRPGVQWTGSGFRVLVRKEDAARARDILDRPRGASTQQSG
jgi:putative signal transducing protein